MDRKGMAMSTLVMLIVFTVILLILLNFVVRYRAAQAEGSNLELCRFSILNFQETREKTAGLVGAPAFDCKAQEDVIKTTNKNTVMHEIADHMRWCWYKSLGRNNKVGIEKWATVDWLSKDVDWCLVCSEFSLAPGTPTVFIPDMINYLQTQKVPKTQDTFESVINDCWIHEGKVAWDRVFATIDRKCEIYTDGSYSCAAAAASGPCPVNPGCHERSRHGSWSFVPSVKNEPAKKYYVIFTSGDAAEPCATRFNHLLVIPESEVPNIKCDAVHHQAA